MRHLLLVVASVAAMALPGDADRLLPTLGKELNAYWPSQSPREWSAGLIEQESNWKLKAKLQTKRELGCGLGQFTVAYNADGSVRFDALEETKRLDPSLNAWSWRDCYAEQYQLRAVVLKLRVNHRQCQPLMKDSRESNACAAAMYNGGGGAVSKRIRQCTGSCNPRAWFGHLERLCAQSSKRESGYGESFCEINAKYPGRVETRMVKYKGKV